MEKGAKLAQSDERPVWPEKTSSWWSQATYSYMDSVLSVGAKRGALQASDLPKVPSSESTVHVMSMWEAHKGGRWSIVAAGLGPMSAAARWQLATATGQILEPLLLRYLVVSAGSTNAMRWGLAMAGAIALNSFGKAFAQQRQLHLSTRAGQRVRASAIAAIYRGALTSTRSEVSIATLAAVDATKLFEVAIDLHLLWSAPIQVVVVSALLVIYVGSLPAAFAGIACLSAVIPMAKFCMSMLIMLRRKRAPFTDARVSEISEVLQGIRVTKVSGWEPQWTARWRAARSREVAYTRLEMFSIGMSLLTVVMSPVVATIAVFCTRMLTDRDARITSADAFTVVALISTLRFPINKLGTLIGQVAQGWRSLDRIHMFVKDLKAPISRKKAPGVEDDAPLVVRRGSFARDNATFVVGRRSRIDLRVAKGELVCVLGPVGSGKSTIVDGLLGDVDPVDANVVVARRGAVGLAPQKPCVLNATVRDNILFGRTFNKADYERALEAAQLDDDIQELPAGDLTEIGERGVTLSGGQKARVGVARVVYARPDIAILDDPLSALDSKTARSFFEAVFDERAGVLRDAAVVLVTHAVRVAPRASSVVVVDDQGEVVFNGPWAQAVELCNKDTTPAATRQALEPLVAAANSGDADNDVDDAPEPNVSVVAAAAKGVGGDPRAFASLKGRAGAQLVQVERREEGMASFATWRRWCRAAGGAWFLTIQLLALALDRACYVATEYWLARWADAREDGATVFGQRFPSQRNGLSGAWRWARVYIALGAASMIFCFSRTQWGFYGGVTAAKRLYNDACAKVLRAPISYFDATPTGRLVSRFSFDAEQIDIVLTQKAAMALISVGWGVTGVSVMLVLTRGLMALILGPVAVIFYRLQLFYRQSSVDLQRLDAVSRSPLQQLLAEAVDAAACVRAFGVKDHFQNAFFLAVDRNTEAMLAWTAAQRWIGFRLDCCAASVATFAALVVAVARRRIGLSESFSGMLMVWSFNLTITFMYLITTFSEAENAITSVERMTEIVPAETLEGNDDVGKAWPQSGDVVFDNVCLRYRPGLPLALDRLSFRVPPKNRCAIVGRTGSGKSSTTVALFRLFPLESGDVFVDGVPLSRLTLQGCRKRAAHLIPQDPVLFSGTVRKSVDPFDAVPDSAVQEALRLVMPARDVDITARVDDGGSNFSTGERQLLALARALVAKPKVLVLDEATSSLDEHTDAYIQRLLRTLPQLKDTTVLCVAHVSSCLRRFLSHAFCAASSDHYRLRSCRSAPPGQVRRVRYAARARHHFRRLLCRPHRRYRS